MRGERHTLTNDDGESIVVVIAEAAVPTTAAEFHASATHVDALGMPVAFWYDDHYSDGKWPYHPSPCCGASATIAQDDALMCCKACWEEIDWAFGNHPLEPYRLIGEVA